MTDKYDRVVAALAELIALTDTPPTLFTDAKEVLEALQRECDEWKAAAEASYGHDLETALSDLAATRALLRDLRACASDWNAPMTLDTRIVAALEGDKK